MSKLICFLIRLKLGVRNRQLFKFTNQKNNDIYYFENGKLYKKVGYFTNFTILSGVSMNWLLDNNCEIIKGDVTQ